MLNKIVIIVSILLFFPNQSFSKWLDGNKVVFQGLDKITARIKTIEISIGEKHNFGILEILVKRCVFSKPTEAPESMAYLTIIDNSKSQLKLSKTKVVFEGWMFAASPALNTMEHPVYDLTLISCKKFKTSSNNSSSDLKKE